MDWLGTDLSARPDLSMKTVSGRKNVAEAIIRRLMTPRGGLFYDSTYGTDVREWMNESLLDDGLYELAAAVAAECEKDERVLEARVTPIPIPEERFLKLEVELELVDASEPLRLILGIGETTVEVLYAP